MTSTCWRCRRRKCPDDQFPVMSFLASGYDVVFCGRADSTVGHRPRVGLESVQYGFDGQPAFADVGVEARAVAAVCDGVQVWSLYVPNGRSLTDPHYAYKLEWLSALADRSALWFAHDPAAQIVLAGDWNVAPTDDDVWDRTLLSRADRTSPRPNELHSPRSPVTGSPTRRSLRARLHLLGLHPVAVSTRRGRAHRLPAVLTGAR